VWLRANYRDRPIPFKKLLRQCREAESKHRAFLEEPARDPRKPEHFRRIVLRNFRDRGARGFSKDELLEAMDDDYFWTVEEKEAFLRVGLHRAMRKLLLRAREIYRDENASH
jgi:hypothetical protein